MNDPDIRWRQRYQHFTKALTQLGRAVDMSRQRALNEIEQQGLIKAFEFTHELAWNVLKDYLEYQGIVSLIGSRDATREAFQMGLIEDGEGWMEMIRSRNMTSHTYNEDVANEIAGKVVTRYYSLLSALHDRLAEFTDAE